ncbi:MAG: hypothetical protein ACO3RU_06155 [Planctomycetota bacterium]
MKILATLLAGAALAHGLSAQGNNLLTNGDFDQLGGGLAGWGAFGNSYGEASAPPAIEPRSGTHLAKMFGNFSGGFNVSGIFQSFPAAAGETYTLDCWSRHYSGDPMVGTGAPNSNWVVQKIAFFDAGGNEIGAGEGTVCDATFPTDVWIDNAPVSATAPLGTASVQALILYLQPNFDGGAVLIDDVEFFGPPPSTPAYPGTGDDVGLATAIGGGALSTGAGNDIKSANGGQLLEVNVSSPNGGYDLAPYWLLAQVFSTATPPVAATPGVYFDFAQPVLILAGFGTSPIGGPVIAPGNGSSNYYLAPAGLAGSSIMLQGLVFSTSASNGIFAMTDGHEIQLN